MALQQIANTDISSTGTFALGSISSSTLTSGRVTYATTGGLLTDSSSLTFNGSTLTASSLSGGNITNTNLTSGRITYASTGGLLVDSASFTYNGTYGLTTNGVTQAYNTLLYQVDGTLSNYSASNNVYLNGNIGGGISLRGSGNAAQSIGMDGAASGVITFYTNSTERMRITSAGLVGIGTATPATALDVASANSGITLTNTGVSNKQWRMGISSSASFQITETGIADRLTITTVGNVGIGTTSPDAQLDVTRSGNGQIAVLQTSANRGFSFESQSDTALQISSVQASTNMDLWSNTLSFSAGGSERMRITSAGLVGIGTATPARVLELKAAQACMVFNDNSNVWTIGTGSFIDGSNSFNFYLGGVGSYLRINASGNLGLGLGLVPSAWLASSKAMQIGDYASFWWDGYTGSTAIGNNVYQSGNTTDNYIVSGVASTRYRLAGGAHAWFIAPSGTAGNAITFTQAMTLNASGNLGVGTTSPAAFTGFTTNRTVLQIANTTSDSGQIILGGSTNALLLDYNNAAGDVTIRNTYGASAAGALINIDSGTLVFRTGTSYTERMRITSAGKTIIGSNTTVGTGGDAQLTVNGNSLVVTPNTAGKDTHVLTTGAADYGTYAIKADTVTKVYLNTNGDSYLTGGNFLVGVTNTAHTSAGFTVEAGGVPYTTRGSGGTLMGFYNLSAATIGSITNSSDAAVLYNTTSDQRLKTNIVNAPSGNINSIKVRSFDWIASGSHQEYGMVAQELLEVAPYAVYQPENPNEMMGVDYSKLVPMMIKSIQEQQALIESLRTEFDEYKATHS